MLIDRTVRFNHDGGSGSSAIAVVEAPWLAGRERQGPSMRSNVLVVLASVGSIGVPPAIIRAQVPEDGRRLARGPPKSGAS